MTTEVDPRRQPLTTAAKRYLIRDHISLVVGVSLALAAAGTLRWYNAWVYAAVFFLVKVASALVLVRTNPAVLDARGTKRPLSTIDRRFFLVFIPAMLSIPVVAGLDAGAVGWTHHSPLALAAGITMAFAGMGVTVWALAVNRFFEPTVRIQRDRGHRVCTAGPYQWVRHPGYVGAILGTASLPLIFGSPWCLVPVAIVAVALVVRTGYEDRLLQAELEGYATYAARTRFRLVPSVW